MCSRRPAGAGAAQTSNAMMTAILLQALSEKAIIYSDSSVLERHHLASAFQVLHSTGYNILSTLPPTEFRELRALIIEIVLHTDLARHFEFISKLSTVAATKGYTAFQEGHRYQNGKNPQVIPAACATPQLPSGFVKRNFTPGLAKVSPAPFNDGAVGRSFECTPSRSV